MHGSWCVILLMLQKSDEHQWSLVLQCISHIFRGVWSIPGPRWFRWFLNPSTVTIGSTSEWNLSGLLRQAAVELAQDHFDEGAAAMAPMQSWYRVAIVDLVVPVLDVMWNLPPFSNGGWIRMIRTPKSFDISGRVEVAEIWRKICNYPDLVCDLSGAPMACPACPASVHGWGESWEWLLGFHSKWFPSTIIWSLPGFSLISPTWTWS